VTKETFSRYDSADCLQSEDDIAAYLEVVAEAGDDPAFMAHAQDVVARVRKRLIRDQIQQRSPLKPH